jgi:hypothetical protein
LKKKSGRGSQGAWRQGELIGGKPPVTLTLAELEFSLLRCQSQMIEKKLQESNKTDLKT